MSEPSARQLAHEHFASRPSQRFPCQGGHQDADGTQYAHTPSCDALADAIEADRAARDRQHEAALAVLAGIARPNGVLCRTCGDTVETCDMDNNPGDECAGKLARGFFASSESAAPAGTAPTPIMCDWCGGRGHGLLDEAGFVACPKCKGTGAVITVPAAAPAQEVAPPVPAGELREAIKRVRDIQRASALDRFDREAIDVVLRVTVHNDYRLGETAMTFWLLTHPDGRWIKGEGQSDATALSEALDAAALPTGMKEPAK